MKVLSKNTRFIPVLGLVFLVGSSIFMSRMGRVSQGLSIAGEGVNTCFSRVGQSYTAKLIGDRNSVYLEKDFTKMTEECLGEAMGALEVANLADKGESLKKLNLLSNDVHWFHERLLSRPAPGGLNNEGAGAPERVIVSNLGTRFEKLEIKKDEVIEQVDLRREVIKARSENINYLFLLSVFLTPFFILFDFIAQRGHEKKRAELELNAKNMLDNEGQYKKESVESLIKTALEIADLRESKRLFDTYRTRNEIGRSDNIHGATKTRVHRGDLDLDRTGTPLPITGGGNEERNAQLRKLWDLGLVSEKSEDSIINLEAVEVDSIFGNVVNLLSSRIFTKGIKLDIDAEETSVYANEESLEQIFYHILVNSIETYGRTSKVKTLSVKMRSLGGTLLIDFYDLGERFPESLLLSENGVRSSDKTEMNQYIELSICKELIQEFGGSISFENITNEDQEYIGRKVQISLRSIPGKGKLVSVQKTTKRELRKRLRARS